MLKKSYRALYQNIWNLAKFMQFCVRGSSFLKNRAGLKKLWWFFKGDLESAGGVSKKPTSCMLHFMDGTMRFSFKLQLLSS